MKKSRIILLAGCLLSGVLFITFAWILFPRSQKKDQFPVLGSVQYFELTTSQDQKFTLNNLMGKVWVADFIFTTCGGICPLMTKNMAQLHRSYVLEEGVEMVSFTVNPENDTPAVLREYAKRYQADTRKWHFLTGQREYIEKIAIESFKVGSWKEPIFHSDRFVLVDRQGRIRGYYIGTQKADIERLFTDIAFLLQEPSNP